jgi:hypothetical protein
MRFSRLRWPLTCGYVAVNMLQRDWEQTEAWVKQFVKRVPLFAKDVMLGVLRVVFVREITRLGVLGGIFYLSLWRLLKAIRDYGI